jgi:hypothetical protein
MSSKMRLRDINLHDAQISAVRIDYSKRTVSFDLAFYESEEAPRRTRAVLQFEGVVALSHMADFERLADNFKSGHVQYWVPQPGHGTTFIYLMDGAISITARRTRMVTK